MSLIKLVDIAKLIKILIFIVFAVGFIINKFLSLLLFCIKMCNFVNNVSYVTFKPVFCNQTKPFKI